MDEKVDLQDSFSGELVTEMATGVNTLVSLSPELVESVTEGDDHPVFATYCIESGWSENKRYWPPEVLANIAEQINNASDPVVGYRGHIPPNEDPYVFPEIGVHWLKAVTQVSQDSVKLFVKGYALPGTKARDYIKRKIAKVVSVSGKALLKPIQGGVAVKDFDLSSIDLARPRAAGMKTSLVAVTQEMEGGNVKPEEIAALQENELRAHNPNLVKGIEDKATEPLSKKITEMETSADGADENATLLTKIRAAFEIDEKADLLEAIGVVLSKVKDSAKVVRERLLDEALVAKFKDEKSRNLVKRVLVTEMNEIDTEDEAEAKKKVEEMVAKAIDEDDTLKSFVSEAGGGHSLSSKSEDRGERKIEPGYENERISVRKAGVS